MALSPKYTAIDIRGVSLSRHLPLALFVTTLFALACSDDAQPGFDLTIATEQTLVAGLSRDPTPEPALGVTCDPDFPPVFSRTKGPGGGDVAFRRDPFCIAWTDIFPNETGFRVALRYSPSDQFEYLVPANVNEFYPPRSDWPDQLPNLDDLDASAGILAGYRRKDIAITVFAQTPAGEVVVDGFALIIQ
jgi:hypothetical protein